MTKWFFFIILFFQSAVVISRCLFSFQTNLAPFLKQKYLDLNTNQEYSIRQVPGHGSCLFDALSVCYQYQTSSRHQPYNKSTKLLSNSLRKSAIDILLSNRTLAMNQHENISSFDLLEQTAREYNITPSLYCEMMLDSSTWGGGPEILAISALLDYPITIYQLCSKDSDPSHHYISKLCTLGSSISHPNQSLCLLYADGRFPHLTPQEVRTSNPDHFLALFPAANTSQASLSFFPHRYFSRGGRWRKKSQTPSLQSSS